MEQQSNNKFITLSLNQLKSINQQLYIFFIDIKFKCTSNHQSIYACTSQTCKINPFICHQQTTNQNNYLKQCQCNQKHALCIRAVNIHKLIQIVYCKKKNKTPQIQSVINQIIKLYDRAIQQLSKARQQFIIFHQNLGLNLHQRKLINYLENYQLQHITPPLLYQISNQLQKQNLDNKNQLQTKSLSLNEKLPSLQNISTAKIAFEIKLQSIIQYLRLIYQQPVSIISNIYSDISKLNFLFEIKPKQFKLKYQGTSQKFNVSKFHQKCDHIYNTLTIIKPQAGNIIGGFTSLGWDCDVFGKWVKDDKAFVFQMTDINSSLFKKVKCSNGSVYMYKQAGPVFGTGSDIVFYNKKSSNQIFKPPPSYQNRSFHCYSHDYATQGKFKVVEIQVYQIIWN